MISLIEKDLPRFTFTHRALQLPRVLALAVVQVQLTLVRRGVVHSRNAQRNVAVTQVHAGNGLVTDSGDQAGRGSFKARISFGDCMSGAYLGRDVAEESPHAQEQEPRRRGRELHELRLGRHSAGAPHQPFPLLELVEVSGLERGDEGWGVGA